MSPIKKSLYFMAVLIPVVVLTQSPPAMAITVDGLVDICEKMESAFMDITVEYEWSVENPTPREEIPIPNILTQKGASSKKWSSKYPFDEVFLYTTKETLVNESGHSFESTVMKSYDGKITKQLTRGGLSPTGEQVDILIGTISEGRRFAPILFQIPLGFSILRMSLDHEKVPLSERLREKEFIRINESIKQIEGFNVICLELLWNAPNVPILHKKEPNLRICFSTNHGYTPVRYEHMTYKGTASEPSQSIIVTSLEKVSDNLWFPSAGKIDPMEPGPINIYRATKIIVNKGLKNEDFDIEFPPGTRIRNEISGVSYVSSAAEEQAVTSSDNELQNSEPNLEDQIQQSPAKTQKSNRTLIYISMAVVATLLTALIVKKYL